MTAYDRSGPDRSEPPVVTGREVPKTTVVTRSESGMFSCPYDPRCGRLGTWPSPAIVPVTPSIGLALSAPDTLTQHDDRWTFRGRRHRPAHGHDLQAVYGTIAIAAA